MPRAACLAGCCCVFWLFGGVWCVWFFVVVALLLCCVVALARRCCCVLRWCSLPVAFGVFGACLAGAWLSVVCGFGGGVAVVAFACRCAAAGVFVVVAAGGVAVGLLRGFVAGVAVSVGACRGGLACAAVAVVPLRVCSFALAAEVAGPLLFSGRARFPGVPFFFGVLGNPKLAKILGARAIRSTKKNSGK